MSIVTSAAQTGTKAGLPAAALPLWSCLSRPVLGKSAEGGRIWLAWKDGLSPL